MSKQFFLYTDGACRGNPGKAGGGAVLYNENMEEIASVFEYFGITTNNVSEYRALIMGLEMCKQRDIHPTNLNIRADSMLVVNHINGIWKCRHPNLIPLLQLIKLSGPFKTVEHVYRNANKRADALANEAVDSISI